MHFLKAQVAPFSSKEVQWGGEGGGKKSYHAGTLVNPLFVKYCLIAILEQSAVHIWGVYIQKLKHFMNCDFNLGLGLKIGKTDWKIGNP